MRMRFLDEAGALLDRAARENAPLETTLGVLDALHDLAHAKRADCAPLHARIRAAASGDRTLPAAAAQLLALDLEEAYRRGDQESARKLSGSQLAPDTCRTATHAIYSARTWTQLAEFDPNRFSTAREFYLVALESLPDDPACLAERDECAIRIALYPFANGGTGWERALERDPDEPGAHRVEGLLALRRLEPELALDAADRALRVRPGNAEDLVVRAEALLLLGRFDEALSAARLAIAGGAPRLGHDVAGCALAELGSYRESLEELHVALGGAPKGSDAWAWAESAVVLARLGRMDDAAEMTRKAVMTLGYRYQAFDPVVILYVGEAHAAVHADETSVAEALKDLFERTGMKSVPGWFRARLERCGVDLDRDR
jgi:tetratricopeptide (TPR) repeat protein